MPRGTFIRLRGAASFYLSDTGHTLDLVATDDSGGGATRTWTAGSTIPCRVDPLSGSESLVAERLSDRSTHLLTVPRETVEGHEDRFAVDGRGTYAVTAVRSSTGEWLRRLEAVKLEET